MLNGRASIEQQYVYFKLKNRRVMIRIVDDGDVILTTKKLIPFDEIEKYRGQGFKVRGRVAEYNALYSREMFGAIAEGYAFLARCRIYATP